MVGDQTLETVSRLRDLCQVSGPSNSPLSEQQGLCDGWRVGVETGSVRAALTEGLLQATLPFRLDRGPQALSRDVAARAGASNRTTG